MSATNKHAGAWTSEGKVHWLGNAKNGVYPVSDSTAERCVGVVSKAEGHPFGGGPSVGEWGKKHGVCEQMVNYVRKCQGCGKPNAKTLKVCNACGDPLPDEVTTTPNLFSCIMYGFDAVGLSIRHQDENTLVIDDLLALSPCHINAIWTRDWIPDARFLFRDPAKAREIVATMRRACETAFKENFAGRSEFVKAFVKDPPADLLDLVACGFNTPPSQYQLHLQFIMMPMIPFQAAQLAKGVHFTKFRFCPVNYILEGLQAAEKAGGLGFEITLDTPMEAIIDRLSELGISYEDHWTAAYKRYTTAQESHGNWSPENFATTLCESSPEADVKKAETADRLLLQSYGRPYNEEGFPAAGNHYKYAKQPGEVKEFVACKM
eukprot:TRINITY_DN17396_c0_g1_i1.p1 TRINITY_DN17396_c0_g1~~TRINITY_DN17396_c0_g1_i1.p1  ORF type:complete len:412 (+),score=57.59 TRINITY_DN17396_c0_g1_i1:106-1236(+)